ncbi:hypothetical protein Q31b_41750 [Novipirellula aureliae]|uniref:Transposase IS200-like domain-containing protein n=1 Tax=Novipirellula aureliae TaxID=2527966 RepID=A0A5C6DP64_9BACT|nr:hypothetical protein Q31b_41750 [Novipirellula aureliae]
MPRKPRYEVADPAEVQVFHLIQRCVRRAYLCGQDRFSGQSFKHRRGWIRDRLEFLASIFGIDCLTYTVLSTHMHIVLMYGGKYCTTGKPRGPVYGTVLGRKIQAASSFG